MKILIEPYKLLSSKILKDYNNAKFSKNQYDCHKINSKGKLIAQHIVNNWYTAYLVSKAKGFNFYAILEPSLFTTGAEYSYFNPVKKNLSPIKKQHDIVYPLVIKEIKKTCKLDSEFCKTIFDGRKWISRESQVYFDAFHFNKEGNKMITIRLLENISKLNK